MGIRNVPREEAVMSAQNIQEDELSYEFYREIAGELCLPVDPLLEADVRFELYSSKLVYLNHLRQHCFRAVNHVGEVRPFSPEDLAHIQKSIELTKVFLGDTVREALNGSLKRLSSGAA
jgi:hypothetical protein